MSVQICHRLDLFELCILGDSVRNERNTDDKIFITRIL